MILEFFQALFLAVVFKIFRVDTAPLARELTERSALNDALLRSMHDVEVDVYGKGFRTFTHHHDQARARRGLS